MNKKYEYFCSYLFLIVEITKIIPESDLKSSNRYATSPIHSS